MAHIQFELDAMGGAHMVAGLVGVPPPQVTGGLCELWAWCWRTKSEIVSPRQLAGIFYCTAADLVEALEAGGFIERVEGGLRVRGAARYLRITGAQSGAGRARAASAKRTGGRFKKASSPPAPHQLPTSSPPAPHQPSPALTPITDHRSPITEESKDSSTASTSEAVRPPRRDVARAADEVLAYWAERRGKPAKFERADFQLVNRALQTFSVEELKIAVDGVARDPWRGRVLQDGVRNVFGVADQTRKFIQLAPLTETQATQLRLSVENKPVPYLNPEKP